MNLLGNSIKFTEEGTITFKGGMCTQVPDMIRFSITDTGIGIPEDKQQILFEMFETGDMSITRRYGGLGLGLALCQRLIKLHRGEIGIRNKPEGGAKAHFTIPVDRADRTHHT